MFDGKNLFLPFAGLHRFKQTVFCQFVSFCHHGFLPPGLTLLLVGGVGESAPCGFSDLYQTPFALAP